jgi:hypothetical protein
MSFPGAPSLDFETWGFPEPRLSFVAAIVDGMEAACVCL